MRKVFLWMLVLLQLALLAGCAPEKYAYVENGEDSYIVLDVVTISDSNDAMAGSVIAPEVRFASLAEMKSDIQSGNFTQEELEEINRFAKNEDGTVATCSVSKLYVPKFSTDYTLEYVAWDGLNYSFTLTNGTENGEIWLHHLDARDYRLQYELTREKTEWGRTTTYEETDNERNGMIYHYIDLLGNQKKISVYEISDGNRTFLIKETYASSEATVPYIVNIWGNDNGNCFFAYMDSPTSRPTMDELKAFGIREYVETVTE